MLHRLKNYLTRDGALNIELFKILGVGGVGISFAACIYCVITMDFLSAAINGSAGILAILLLHFVEKTGHYLTGYFVVEITVFMILFPVMFLTGGGMDGSMPYFFSFGLMFTFLMFEGKLLIIMETLLSVFYLGLCLISLRFPQIVRASGSALSMEWERLIGVFLPAFSMGMIFLLYIREYKKQKQIAEEANRAKSIFLANMSHEIRTPINAVLGFNEIILRGSKENTTREYAGYIEQSGHRLLNVINEVLDFSRIESGKAELVSEHFTLSGLAGELRSLMSVMAKNRNLEYQLESDERLYDAVVGDREKLLRILTNLLSNAFKYTDKGSVALRIHLREVTDAGQRICFAVEDTGIGIRMSEIDNLFHAYERADLVKNRRIEGTGLGLAITEQLLHLFGSSLKVESTYGEGSRFSFEVILRTADSVSVEGGEKAARDSFTAPDTAILVVDDDDMNRRLMDSMLSTFRICSDFAESGEECLDRVQKTNYHLILMDYMMPGLDGAAAMDRIRAEEKKAGKHTPIVVLTADVVDHIDRKLTERGFDGYLSKPVNLTDLERILERFLPEELVIREQIGGKEILSEERYEACDELLGNSGICLAEGLKFVNRDLNQYLRIAEFFVNSAPADMRKVQDAADEEDIESLRLAFHSLKGKAGNVGAEKLRVSAEDLEAGCRNNDMEYVLCGLDLILLQWKRCAEGLRKLLKTECTPNSGETSAYDGYQFEDLAEELRRNLGLCEGRKAREAARLMRRSEKGRSFSRELDEIVDLIERMEFEDAAEETEKLFPRQKDP